MAEEEKKKDQGPASAAEFYLSGRQNSVNIDPDQAYAAYQHAQSQGVDPFSSEGRFHMASFLLGPDPSPEDRKYMQMTFGSNGLQQTNLFDPMFQAQEAREAAARRTQQSVQQRHEGPITEWMENTPERMGGQLLDTAKQAITNPTGFAVGMIGPGDLGPFGFPRNVRPFKAANENIPSVPLEAGSEEAEKFLFNLIKKPEQPKTAENTWVGADRNKYPLTYDTPDEKVIPRLKDIMQILTEQGEKWRLEGYDPSIFEMEFQHMMRRKEELEQRIYEHPNEIAEAYKKTQQMNIPMGSSGFYGEAGGRPITSEDLEIARANVAAEERNETALEARHRLKTIEGGGQTTNKEVVVRNDKIVPTTSAEVKRTSAGFESIDKFRNHPDEENLLLGERKRIRDQGKGNISLDDESTLAQIKKRLKEIRKPPKKASMKSDDKVTQELTPGTEHEHLAEIAETRRDDLEDNMIEAIRDEKPELDDKAARLVMHDMLNGVDYDMPQHVMDMIPQHKEFTREMVGNQRLAELYHADPGFWNYTAPEKKNSMFMHTDAEHKTYKEWEEIAKKEGHGVSGKPNPYIAAGFASRGEWDPAKATWSIGGHKTSIVAPGGYMTVYEHGRALILK